MCDSDVACAVRLQKHMAVKHMAHRKWAGKDTAVKFTTQPQMRHRGGVEQRRGEPLDTRHSLGGDSLRT